MILSTKGGGIVSQSDILGYIGAVVMVVFAFTLNPAIAIIGLTFLTVQAVNAKMWNLVVLNLVSIGGFASNFL